MGEAQSEGLKTRIVMLVTNDVIQDSRVKKEAHALVREGFEVLIAGVASSSVTPGQNVVDGLQVVHFDVKKIGTKLERRDFGLYRKVHLILRIMFAPFILLAAGIGKIFSAPIWIESGLRAKRVLGSIWVAFSSRARHFLLITVGKLLGSKALFRFFRNVWRRARSRVRKMRLDVRGVWRELNLINRMLKFWARLVRLFGVARFNRFLFSRLFARAARAEIISWQPAVVHCHDFDTLLLGKGIAKRVNAKLVYDSHELWSGRNVPLPKSLPNRIMRRVELRQEKQALRAAGLVVTVSEGVRDHLTKIGADSQLVIVVKNIPEISVDASLLGRQRAVEEGTVYYSGRITTGRLLEELVDAVSSLGLPELSINLLGYGPAAYIEGLKGYAARQGVCLTVHAPVASSEVPSRLGSAEVVFVGVEPLVESYRLSLPNKFFEAALSGRPVVIPQLPEIVRESHSLRGFHVMEDFSSQGISEAIKRARTSAFDAHSALEERVTRFSWVREVEGLVAGYRRILQDSRAAQ